MGTLGWILIVLLVLAVALIAPVIASEHGRRRASEDRLTPDREPEQSGANDPDTPAPLPAPPMGPPDRA